MVLFSVQFSALDNFIFSVYTNSNFNRMFSSTFQIFLLIFNKKYYNLTFLQQFFNTCYLFWRNGANVCDTQYLHSNWWWHHTIWWWRKHIPCILTQGNYHLGKLSWLARKDHCFRLYFLSISCKLIWELNYGHWVYILSFLTKKRKKRKMIRLEPRLLPATSGSEFIFVNKVIKDL